MVTSNASSPVALAAVPSVHCRSDVGALVVLGLSGALVCLVLDEVGPRSIGFAGAVVYVTRVSPLVPSVASHSMTVYVVPMRGTGRLVLPMSENSEYSTMPDSGLSCCSTAPLSAMVSALIVSGSSVVHHVYCCCACVLAVSDPAIMAVHMSLGTRSGSGHTSVPNCLFAESAGMLVTSTVASVVKESVTLMRVPLLVSV